MKTSLMVISLLNLVYATLQAQTPTYWAWAATPPMGWNSYDSFGDNVTEAEILANARYQQEHLLAHGWNYVVVDYRWYDPGAHDNNPNGRAGAQLSADEFGRLLPAPNRFPSAADGKGFKPLADQVHAMGMKFGIHVMRGIPRQAVKANTPIAGSNFRAADAADTNHNCGWCPDMFGVNAAKPAGRAWYDSLLRLYAAWGVDFIKVDDLSSPYYTGEIEAVRGAIDKCGRPIVFSTSPGETPVDSASHVQTNANQWRISGDFWDDWKSLDHNFDLLAAWHGAAAPGHWPDADMIPLGHIGERSVGGSRTTRFTRDEQVTMMSLWALAPSPLMLGMDLPQNDAWTLSLLTNDEVLAVNQDALGRQGRRVSQANRLEVWVKDLSGGAKAVGLFNRGRDMPFDDSRALFKSALITRQTPGQSVRIDADITGAKKLYLAVDDGGDGFACDHADWIEPKLTGPAGEKKLTELSWVSATCGWGAVAIGKGVSGGELSVNGKSFADGIGTHSPSVIEYDLPPGYTRFTALGGLDRGGVTQQAAGSTVHFLVFTADPRQADEIATVSVPLQALGFTGPCRVRDLWAQKDAANATGSLARDVPPHGAALLRLEPVAK
ncbi:MAG: NPCBM/NEW2 domain-containing protein [Limisphaerales bacterium]